MALWSSFLHLELVEDRLRLGVARLRLPLRAQPFIDLIEAIVGVEPPAEAHGPQYFMIRQLAAYDPEFRGRAMYPPETFGIAY